MKARFEEAKLRDLGQSAPNSVVQKPIEQSTPANQSLVAQRQSSPPSRTIKYSKCGGTNNIS